MNNRLQKIIEQVYETRSYSGRGMYGKACLGVELDSGESESRFWANVLENVAGDDRGFQECLTAMHETRADSMGLGAIIYFPGVKPPEEDESDDNS